MEEEEEEGEEDNSLVENGGSKGDGKLSPASVEQSLVNTFGQLIGEELVAFFNCSALQNQ